MMAPVFILDGKGCKNRRRRIIYHLPERTTGRRNVHSCKTTNALGSSSLTNLKDILNNRNERRKLN